MSGSYYFLVVGLPDISLDEERISSFCDFMAETEEQVSSDDQKLLKLIRLPFDNVNLVAVLEDSR